jgi:hypothetical protein
MQLTINKFQRKKAQLKIGESILVLLIFFILLTIGLIFYAKVQSHVSEKEMDQFNAKRTIDMALAVKFLPELQCTMQATEEFDCIDALKLRAFKEMMQNNENPSYRRYFARMFPNAKISIKQSFVPMGVILPPDLEEGGVLLFNNTYTGEAEATGIQRLSLPVTIYDPITDSNSFGFVVLDTYS